MSGLTPVLFTAIRGDERIFLDTAWTIQVIRGFGLWFCCLIVGFIVANYYDQPMLKWLIPIAGLNTIIAGFNSTSLASLNRHMEVGKLVRFELGIKILSMAISVIWAWINPTIWALVGGNLISILLMAIWTHRLNSGQPPNHFAWNKDVSDEITSFGKWIFLSTLMGFLASQTDRLMFGRFLSLELLGVYIVAFSFADIPRRVSQKVSSKVIFPVISQLIDLPRKTLRAKILAKRKNILLVLAIAVNILVSFGDLVILTLYDARYEQAAWMVPILALGLWPLLLALTLGSALIAVGKPIYPAVANFCKLIYMVTLLPLAVSKMGIFGALLVVAFNDLPFYGMVNYGLWKERLTGMTQDLQATAALLGLIALTVSVRYALGFGLPIDAIL